MENATKRTKIQRNWTKNCQFGARRVRGTFLEGSRTQKKSKKGQILGFGPILVHFGPLLWILTYLSEDPGPHAVFFSCVRRAGRGGGIQGVSVVVVVVANFDKIIEIREMVK